MSTLAPFEDVSAAEGAGGSDAAAGSGRAGESEEAASAAGSGAGAGDPSLAGGVPEALAPDPLLAAHDCEQPLHVESKIAPSTYDDRRLSGAWSFMRALSASPSEPQGRSAQREGRENDPLRIARGVMRIGAEKPVRALAHFE